jgi:hypothetical protein
LVFFSDVSSIPTTTKTFVAPLPCATFKFNEFWTFRFLCWQLV